MHQWFKHDEVWHAFNLADRTALCGEVSIAYGVDPIAQEVPEGRVIHDACLKAIEEVPVDPEPVPFPEPSASEPEPEPEEEAEEPEE